MMMMMMMMTACYSNCKLSVYHVLLKRARETNCRP